MQCCIHCDESYYSCSSIKYHNFILLDNFMHVWSCIFLRKGSWSYFRLSQKQSWGTIPWKSILRIWFVLQWKSRRYNLMEYFWYFLFLSLITRSVLTLFRLLLFLFNTLAIIALLSHWILTEQNTVRPSIKCSRLRFWQPQM